MMQLVIVFKSGKEVRITCQTYDVRYDMRGRVKSILWWDKNGYTPLYVDIPSIACVYCEKVGDSK